MLMVSGLLTVGRADADNPKFGHVGVIPASVID